MKSKRKLSKQVDKLINIIIHIISPVYKDYTSTMPNKTFKYFYGKR